MVETRKSLRPRKTPSGRISIHQRPQHGLAHPRSDKKNGRPFVTDWESADLAVNGGRPVREVVLPYARQQIRDADIAAVVEVLRSDMLTTGPRVGAFEKAFAEFVGAEEAVAVSSGTAALHASFFALGIGQGDEVIVPSMTFASTASTVVFQGGTPIFSDVLPESLLVDPSSVEEKITPATRAIVAVDFAGQPCDFERLSEIANERGLALVDDACHALGATYQGKRLGAIADLTSFSTHSVKHVATGEGGVVTTQSAEWASQMRRFRNHGISRDVRQREQAGSWYYEIEELGFNYRLTDIQCALGLSQLRSLEDFLVRRRQLAAQYDEAFAAQEAVKPLGLHPGRDHAYHLYVLRLDLTRLKVGRSAVFSALRAEGVGVNVHYIPAHLHPIFQKEYGTHCGQCPEAERAYEEIFTIPLFPTMTTRDMEDVILAIEKVMSAYAV